jgi:pyrroline-5-carboxylate reductase
MGGALLSGWREQLTVAVLDPAMEPIAGVRWLSSASELASMPAPRAVVLAVKPALVAQLLPSFAGNVSDDTMFLSVAAGVRIETLQAALGASARVARTMPNIAVSKRAGATAICFGLDVPQDDQERCLALFRLVGEAVPLESEALIDVATALAGSGPAFFFRFAEALATAAQSAGMAAASARVLAEATLRGAGALCDGSASLGELRAAVTSPGGTTAAGLDRLERDGRIDSLALDTVAAAIARAQELGQ